MDTPREGSRIRNILAGAVLAGAFAVGGYFFGRDSVVVPPPPAPPETVTPTPTPRPAVVPDALLQRADLIGLAAAAADELAGGPAAPRDSLAGRRFIIRIPFGCAGSEAADAPFGWSYDGDSETLRIRVTPADWTGQSWVSDRLPEDEGDAVEGFWLPRPWTRSERCPTSREAVPADRPSSVGIAQFFGSDSSRVSQRRGRPLEFATNLAPEDAPLQGLHLILEGRIARVPGSRSSALCHAPGAYDRPTCLVAAEFDRVAVENPVTQAEIANWRM